METACVMRRSSYDEVVAMVDEVLPCVDDNVDLRKFYLALKTVCSIV